MISPSRRKRPTTPPNTPTFASAFGKALAGVALLALAAAPLSAQDQTRDAQVPAALPAYGSITGHARAPFLRSSDATSASAAAPIVAAPRPKASKTSAPAGAATRPAGSKVTTGAVVSAPPVKKTARPIRPATFEEVPGIEADEILPGLEEPVPQMSSVADNSTRLVPNQRYQSLPVDESEQARRDRLRAQLTRPFKRISEIHPFYDYEPDAEQLAQDRCFNLCPRPGSPDCPECGPEGAEGKLQCAECPVEIDLRDTARVVASINDFPTRSFPHMDYCWEPTNLYAYPLYFEDFALERYGHTRHYLIQAPFSVGLFAAQFIGLPYQITIDPIAKKRYALGWYRPGQYVPYKYYQVPWNTEAAVVEAGVIAGSTFLWAPSLAP